MECDLITEVSCLIVKIVNGSLAHGVPIKQSMLLLSVTEKEGIHLFKRAVSRTKLWLVDPGLIPVVNR